MLEIEHWKEVTLRKVCLTIKELCHNQCRLTEIKLVQLIKWVYFKYDLGGNPMPRSGEMSSLGCKQISCSAGWFPAHLALRSQPRLCWRHTSITCSSCLSWVSFSWTEAGWAKAGESLNKGLFWGHGKLKFALRFLNLQHDDKDKVKKFRMEIIFLPLACWGKAHWHGYVWFRNGGGVANAQSPQHILIERQS